MSKPRLEEIESMNITYNSNKYPGHLSLIRDNLTAKEYFIVFNPEGGVSVTEIR